MSRKLFLILGALAFFLLAAVFLMEGMDIEPSDRLQVVTTIYPLGAFARVVGGEDIFLKVIAPPGVEPHDFEPTAKDVAGAYEADVFIVNGVGIDPWAEKIIPELLEKGVEVMLMSSDLDASLFLPQDPHFWLDPFVVQKELALIRDVFASRDQANAERYAVRAEAYIEDIKALQEEYMQTLASCSLREIVSSHDAFAYLGRRYDITIHPLAGLSPEAEPSSQELAQIVGMIREKGITYIFSEPLVSEKLSETIAAETGAQVLSLDPFESPRNNFLNEEDYGYRAVMRENLYNIEKALSCL